MIFAHRILAHSRWLWLPLVGLSLAAFIALSTATLPLPDARITIASGPEQGMYHQHAQRYARRLQDFGIEATVLVTAGTVENLTRLSSAQPSADVGFAQGGVELPGAAPEQARSVATIANIDVEPVWMFSKRAGIDALTAFSGQRIGVGPVGSGSRPVALDLLAQYRLAPKDVVLSDLTGVAAVNAVKAGELDAAIFVSAPDSAGARALLASPELIWVSLRRSAALLDRMPYLEPKLVPQGTLGAVAAQPPKDTLLLTTMTSLVVRQGLSPAIARVLAQTAKELHSGKGALVQAHEFPSYRRVEFPSSGPARRTLANGLNGVDTHLDVVTAQWFYRLLLIGLPLLLLAVFIWRALLRFARRAMETEIQRCYGELKFIEMDIKNLPPVKRSALVFRTRLGHLTQRVDGLHVHQRFSRNIYALRQHLAYVKHQVSN